MRVSWDDVIDIKSIYEPYELKHYMYEDHKSQIIASSFSKSLTKSNSLQNQFFSMSHYFSKEVDKLWASSYVQQLFDT